jgi:hypothetical protein
MKDIDFLNNAVTLLKLVPGAAALPFFKEAT